MGPYRVIRETQGKAYILEELNINVLQTMVVAFQLVPYVRRDQLDGWVQLIDAWDQDGLEQSESESGSGENN